mgnify:FL=1
MKKNNDALENAGGKEILCETEQGADKPASDAPSVGKFADAESLLKAYNQLESEFTKRSQRLRELEREYADLKQEQSDNRAESEAVQDETGSAAEERASKDSVIGEDGGIAIEVERFLKANPEAGLYADEIVKRANLEGEPESGFLDRAYVGVLKDMLRREKEKITDEFILERALNTKSVRDEIIRGYLAEIYSAKRECLLTGSSGESAIAPPIKPSTISEAGKMAVSVLRKK